MWLLSLIPDSILYGFVWMMIVAGAVGYVATMFSFLMPYSKVMTPLVRVLSVALMVGGVYLYGGYGVNKYWLDQVKKQKEEIARIEKESQQVTEKIVVEYKEKIKVVKEKGDVIIQKVPEYITKESDTKCVVPNSFVVLHDSAAKNEVPDSTKGVDEGTSAVKLSDVARTVTINYNNYHQLTEQLKALQDWVKQQEKVYNGN